MVVVLSVMAAKDVSHGDLPWPTAWICFLPSLLVLSLQSRLRCLFQATLAGVALAFIATWILHGHPLAEHLPYDSKFVPVAIAVVMTAALHIRFSLTRQRPA